MAEVVDQALKCPNCGAPLEVELGAIILTCRYCGSDIKVAGDKKFYLKHSLIPSKLRKEDVESLVIGWMNSGFYKPEDLGRKSRIVSMDCVLLPFFVVGAHVTSVYSGCLTRMGGRIDKAGELAKEYFWNVLARGTSSSRQGNTISLSAERRSSTSHCFRQARGSCTLSSMRRRRRGSLRKR